MGYYDEVDNGDVGYMARWGVESLWAHEGERGAALFEDRVEEDSEAGGEFNVVTGVAKPCCS
jgi:hypothetical protein